MNNQSLHAAVVYNPIKVDLENLKSLVNAAATEAGWGDSMWFATTEEEAGQRATASALRRGADVVLAAGGDGTVRAVAEGLRGSDVPIALLPSGTGNLLARNLDLDVTDLEGAIRSAFTDGERRVDLGLVEVTRESGEKETHAFLVMAGLGLDAKMMANTNPELKKAVGWLAYVDAGVRSVAELKPMRLNYRVDKKDVKTASVHTILIGNCGKLPGGLMVMPDAMPDDGILDIVAMRPQGRFGWLRVWNKVAWENGVLRKSAMGRKIIDLSKDVKDVMSFRGRELNLEVTPAQEFELDGDEYGEVVAMKAWVEERSLRVKDPVGV
ncbi:diacylglycerol kinase [Glaciihabitans arcticus]|uniref:Diacylglycerol kinase n=1 Tax=Glaciihabitans arcticus TaxID=2668039 RepID=A0A4Q9GYG8_9MICO|nr:diacylglycerol kinase family protein [Glaciihabitans arcticus]TBN58287.1 diacylglycerol kinase [Glaciihabitans arcticus]